MQSINALPLFSGNKQGGINSYRYGGEYTHVQLIKLLQLIHRLETYIAADERDLQSGAYNLFEHIRTKTLQRITDRAYIVRRLKKYYAKKLFVLAAEVYDDVRGI